MPSGPEQCHVMDCGRGDPYFTLVVTLAIICLEMSVHKDFSIEWGIEIGADYSVHYIGSCLIDHTATQRP